MKRSFTFPDLTPHLLDLDLTMLHASRCTLDFGFTVRVSHPAMGGTPLKIKKAKKISQKF